MFQSRCYLMQAKVLARRFALARRRGGLAWVTPYNAAVQKITEANRADATNMEAVQLARVLTACLPRGTGTGR